KRKAKKTIYTESIIPSNMKKSRTGISCSTLSLQAQQFSDIILTETAQHLFAWLDDLADQLAFFLLQFIYLFFNRSFRNQSDNLNDIFLAKTMRTSCRLIFHCRIPPQII